MVSTSRTYNVAIYEAEPGEGGYWCEVIDLPGCVAQGETLDQLKENMIEAIIACEETLHELGDESRTPRPGGHGASPWSGMPRLTGLFSPSV